MLPAASVSRVVDYSRDIYRPAVSGLRENVAQQSGGNPPLFMYTVPVVVVLVAPCYSRNITRVTPSLEPVSDLPLQICNMRVEGDDVARVD